MTTNQNEDRFQHQRVYRGKAVEWKLDRTKEHGGTTLVEIMIEVTLGPLLGRRMRWTGWLTDAAIDRTVDEMSAMGWRAVEFGRWDGLGEKEVEFTCMAERQGERTYYRAAFVRSLASLTQRNAVSETELASLSRRYAHVLKPRSSGEARIAEPPPSDGFDYDAPPPNEDPEELPLPG